jgi:hypothetical protein
MDMAKSIDRAELAWPLVVPPKADPLSVAQIVQAVQIVQVAN